tara:strand:- start:224 stop:433 length:210 start_codon:yes stop_codon:yes gene_type:complete
MKIKVNGKETLIKFPKQKISLKHTLEYLGYRKDTVIVEFNNHIINSENWSNHIIEEGDKLEIVSIVGGG